MGQHVRNKIRKPEKLQSGKYSDGGGLWLWVADNGNRKWVYRYSRQGKRRELGLGSFKDVGLAEARSKASKYRSWLADGYDPAEEAEIERAERKAQADELKRSSMQSLTFGSQIEPAIALRAKSWTCKKTEGQWVSRLTTHASGIADIPLSELRPKDIANALEKLWHSDKTETAQRTLSAIRAVLTYASANEIPLNRGVSDMIDETRILLGRPKSTTKRMASMPYSDVPEFFNELAQSDIRASQSTLLALKFLTLTACRSGEVRNATWDEIHWEDRVWIIPSDRMKASRTHEVPLTNAMIEILEEARSLTNYKYIFPGNAGKPLSDMTLTRLLRRNDCKFTVHGFRSSFRTWAAEQTDYPRELAEHALAHAVGNAVERAYQRSGLTEARRPMMEDWESFLKASKDV